MNPPRFSALGVTLAIVPPAPVAVPLDSQAVRNEIVASSLRARTEGGTELAALLTPADGERLLKLYGAIRDLAGELVEQAATLNRAAAGHA